MRGDVVADLLRGDGTCSESCSVLDNKRGACPNEVAIEPVECTLVIGAGMGDTAGGAGGVTGADVAADDPTGVAI